MNLLKEAQIALLSGLAKYKPGTKIILWDDQEIEVLGNGKYSVVLFSANKYWYLNSKLHRKDGPAVEHINGDKWWYKNGKLHRLDGPAVEYASSYKAWYLNGKRHRIDGPAIEWVEGDKKWYLNGINYSEEGWNIERKKYEPT